MIFSIADRNQEALEGTADELSDRPTVRTLGLLTNKRAHHANVVHDLLKTYVGIEARHPAGGLRRLRRLPSSQSSVVAVLGVLRATSSERLG